MRHSHKVNIDIVDINVGIDVIYIFSSAGHPLYPNVKFAFKNYRWSME